MERAVSITNTHQPYARQAIYLPGEDKKPELSAFLERIMQAIAAKRKIAIVWTSVKRGREFAEQYLEPLVKSQGLRYAFYCSESTRAQRDELRDVEQAWAPLDVLMYTTSITVGLSYNPTSESAPAFDELFLYACAASATPRDVAQALLRCRVLKANRLTYTIDLRGSQPSVRGLTAVKQMGADKKRRLVLTHPVVDWHGAPKWAEDNWAYNENEQRISRCVYREVLERYLLKCGYELRSDLTAAAVLHELERTADECWEDIPRIDAVVASVIEDRIKRDQAEAADQDCSPPT